MFSGDGLAVDVNRGTLERGISVGEQKNWWRVIWTYMCFVNFLKSFSLNLI